MAKRFLTKETIAEMESEKPTVEQLNQAKQQLLKEMAHDAFMLGVDWVLDILMGRGDAFGVRATIKGMAESQWKTIKESNYDSKENSQAVRQGC